MSETSVTVNLDNDWAGLSLRLEAETGYDSIPTIVRIYDRTGPSGRYVCPFPTCDTTISGAERMWRHVHFSRKHGLSFGVKTPELLKVSGA